MPKGKPYPPEFKAKVSLEAMEGGATVNEIAARYDLNPNLVRNWKAKAESDLARVFSVAEDEKARERELAEHEEEVDDLHRMIGRLTAERDRLRRRVLAHYGIDLDSEGGAGGPK